MEFNEDYALLYDLDGTLTNSGGPLAEAFGKALEMFGYKFTPDIEKRLTGLPVPDGFSKVAIDEYGDGIKLILDRVWTAQERFEKKIIEKLHDGGKLIIEGIFEFCKREHSKGTIMKIGSSSNRSRLEMILKISGLEGFFSEIAASEDVIECKPSPDIWLKIEERLPRSIKKIYVIGDTPFDVISGHEFSRITPFDVEVLWIPDVVRPTKETPYTDVLAMCGNRTFDSILEVEKYIQGRNGGYWSGTITNPNPRQLTPQ